MSRGQVLPLEVREAAGVAELEDVSALLGNVWNRPAGSRQMTVSLLRALSMTGNYVGAAFLGDRLVGAAVGFFAPASGSMHSHITGVDAGAQARNIGYTLKMHQRAWALERGIPLITWTYDPVVRRNAYFNLVKLGARATTYLPDFYGPMDDGLNRGEESDRLLVAWQVGAGEPAHDLGTQSAGLPALLHEDAGVVTRTTWTRGAALVPVPEDIERLRAESPALAQAWRGALRHVLGTAMADGAVITGFDKHHGYLIDDPTPAPADLPGGPA
ncbi:MAG: GNAT family N-acetyltransferase [Nocardioidaceae bacterium]|nr:GNAT family N-acetyltransferase [Nocardioidaceae bacterium]